MPSKRMRALMRSPARATARSPIPGRAPLAVRRYAPNAGCPLKVMTFEQWQEGLASRTHTRRLMTLAEVAGVAAFMASDKATGMTGTTVNLSMGALDD